MFCNHENITDYCINNFTYSYASLTNDGFYLYPDSGNAAPVIRQDLTTGDIKNISILSTDIVQSCDSGDDLDNITEWECYQLYRNLSSNTIQNPPIELYKDYQKKLVAIAYSDTLDYGIKITLNEKIFILSSKTEDIIYYAGLASQAQYLYDTDPDNQMPSFFDKDGNTHSLSYADLIEVLKEYLNKILEYKNLIDNINKLIDDATTIEEINDLGWCDDRVVSSLENDTKIEDKDENPPIIPELPPVLKDFSKPCRSYRIFRCTSYKALTATGYDCLTEEITGDFCTIADPDPYINNLQGYNLGSYNYLLSYSNDHYYLWGAGCFYQPGYSVFNPSPCLYDGLTLGFSTDPAPYECECDTSDQLPTE